MRTFVKFCLAVFVVCGLIAGKMGWEHHQTLQFCENAHPGLPYAQLETLFLQYGSEGYWRAQFEDKDHPGVWKVYLPDPSTIGEMACTVWHDRVKVISSKYGR
jgi:hypothetical protein